MYLVEWVQSCADKCLRTSFWGWEAGWFTELANFCGVNITTRARFRLPPWFHQMGNQEEKCSDLSSLRKPVPVPIPSHSRQIIGYWTAFFKKKKVGVQSAYWAFLFLSGIGKLRARTEFFQTMEGSLCCDGEPRQRQRRGRRKGERRRIFREEIWAELRCLKGIALAFAMRYAMSLWGGHSGKEPACQCRRRKTHGFDPWDRKISWRKKWQPLHYACLGNPMDRESWWATVHGITKSQTQLSTHTHQYTHTCNVTLLPHLLQKIFSKTLSLHHW